MLENIKKVDKKIIVMAGMVLGIILIIVVAVIIVSLTSGGSISYDKIEEKLTTAAKDYYKDNNGSLPKEIGESVEVDASKLSSAGYIKDISDYAEDGVTCSGKVYVTKTSAGYDYATILDCGKNYKTSFLVDKLLENVVTSGNGLYSMEDVVVTGATLGVDEDGYDLSSNELMRGYIYRGDKVDNYIKFGESLYRIIKIDGNNDFVVSSSVKQTSVVFDNRYNSESTQTTGINDYTVSRIYDSLIENYGTLSEKGFIKRKGITKNVCIAPRNVDDIATDGSIECSKVLKDQFYSLIPVFDIMNASLAEQCDTLSNKECMNYNYLITNSGYWTLTPSDKNSYTAYKVSSGIISAKTNTNAPMKHVYYLTNKLVYVSGSGTKADPYIIK